MPGLLTTPRDVTRPQNFCCIIKGFGSLGGGGHSWSSLAAVIAVRIHRQNFFVTEVSLQAELPNYLTVHYFIYHHSALHQFLLLSPINKLQ
jgi:hypothetical protein